MKVLVISPNREQYPCPVAPIGALHIATVLKNNGNEIEFLDLCFINDTQNVVENKLNAFSPDVIVCSIRNIDNEVYLNQKFYLDETKVILNICRKFSSARMLPSIEIFSPIIVFSLFDEVSTSRERFDPSTAVLETSMGFFVEPFAPFSLRSFLAFSLCLNIKSPLFRMLG